MTLTLVISSLGPGGAERVLSDMANYWAAHGHDVTLITLSDESEDFYILDPGVHRVGLGVTAASSNKLVAVLSNMRRILAIRKAIKAAGSRVVVTFGASTNVLSLLALRGTGIRVVVSERVDPRRHNIGGAWEHLRSWVYRGASYVVVQTEELRPWAAALVGDRRTVVIANPIGLCLVPRDTVGHEGRRRLLGVGRLDRQKGFDLFLKAFASIAAECPEWDATILGEGSERSGLEELCRQLGIAGRVSLPGVVSNVSNVMAESDLFVLSSRYEGFPNVLLEAMACGLPVLSFDCPTGPRTIIRNGTDGLLIPPGDTDALAEAMQRLMKVEDQRLRLAENARAVTDRFSIDLIMSRWDQVIG